MEETNLEIFSAKIRAIKDFPEGTTYLVTPPKGNVILTGKESTQELVDAYSKALIKAVEQNPMCIAKIESKGDS
jgi:hypothetical protein